jgi:hypothetical protein
MRVLEAGADKPPRACLFFDGLELLLARAAAGGYRRARHFPADLLLHIENPE